MTFREKLKRLLETASIGKVAQRAGLSVGAIRTYLDRGSLPVADRALALARAFNVELEWLIDDSQAWPPVWMNRPDRKRATASAA